MLDFDFNFMWYLNYYEYGYLYYYELRGLGRFWDRKWIISVILMYFLMLGGVRIKISIEIMREIYLFEGREMF